MSIGVLVAAGAAIALSVMVALVLLGAPVLCVAAFPAGVVLGVSHCVLRG